MVDITEDRLRSFESLTATDDTWNRRGGMDRDELADLLAYVRHLEYKVEAMTDNRSHVAAWVRSIERPENNFGECLMCGVKTCQADCEWGMLQEWAQIPPLMYDQEDGDWLVARIRELEAELADIRTGEYQAKAAALLQGLNP